MPLTIDTATFKYRHSNGNFQTINCLRSDSVIRQTVSGTTPTIYALPNTSYICGECLALTIIPPAYGICKVRFTSGTSATVLTAPDVQWPDWFDPAEIETSRTYEIFIEDGIYGTVTSWPS